MKTYLCSPGVVVPKPDALRELRTPGYINLMQITSSDARPSQRRGEYLGVLRELSCSVNWQAQDELCSVTTRMSLLSLEFLDLALHAFQKDVPAPYQCRNLAN